MNYYLEDSFIDVLQINKLIGKAIITKNFRSLDLKRCMILLNELYSYMNAFCNCADFDNYEDLQVDYDIYIE